MNSKSSVIERHCQSFGLRCCRHKKFISNFKAAESINRRISSLLDQKSIMAPSSKKRRQDDLVEESDLSASDERVMHLQRMAALIDALGNDLDDSAKFEASMK